MTITPTRGPVLPGEPQCDPLPQITVLPPDTTWDITDPGSPLIRFENAVQWDTEDATNPAAVLGMLALFAMDRRPFTVQLCCHPEDACQALDQALISGFGLSQA